MSSKITELMEGLYQENAADDDNEQEIEKSENFSHEIAMLDGTIRPLTPMLLEKFQYAYKWVDAYCGQTWLSLEEIKHYSNDPKIVRCIELRVENWDRDPPATVEKNQCAIFGCWKEQINESYFVWIDGKLEPECWIFHPASVDRFYDFERFLEYATGHREESDNDPSMFSDIG